MKTFIRWIATNWRVTALAMALVMLAGLLAARRLPVDLFPNLDIPVVNVITHYPGAGAEDMELLVTRPIEDEMRGIVGVKRVASASAQGMSQVTVEFNWRVSAPDARQMVQARLARVRNVLPRGVVPRLESIGTTLQEALGYVVYGGADSVTLRRIVRQQVASRLMSVDGVSSVEVLGGDEPAFWITVTPRALAQFGVTTSQVVAAVAQANRVSVAGFMNRSAQEYLVRGDGRLRRIEDLRALPVRVGAGRTVTLETIAAVTKGRRPRHYEVRADRVPAVAFVVRKQPGASTVRVARQAAAKIAALQGIFPPGAKIEKFYDQSEIIVEARQAILESLLMGAGLAVVVLFFFFGAIRPTLAVAATIPITLVATLAVMRWLGVGLNVITMSALALAVGMIVDDAIVVAENIFRHRQQGASELDASLEGAAEIAAADASGTFTTAAAFLPLVLVSGLGALFLRPFGLTISSALVLSLVLSLTLIPMLFSRKGWASPPTDSLSTRAVARLNQALQATLRLAFRHRALVLGAAVLSLGVGGLAGFLGSARMLPPVDEGAILIEYVMPPGTALAESSRVGDALDRVALRDPAVACVYRRTGSPEQGYLMEGVNRGELMIKLKPKSQRRRSLNDVMDRLKAAYSKLDGLVFLYHQPTQEKIDESFSGLPALFGVTVYGPDVNTLIALAGKVETVLVADPAVGNVVNNTKVKSPQVCVRLDNRRLAQYGLSAAEVLTALCAARYGFEATRIVRQMQDIGVFVRLDPPCRDELASIKKLPIRAGADGLIPLDRVARVEVVRAPPVITRLNGQRQVTLLAEVEGNIPSVVSRLRERFRAIALPAGYSIDFTGQYKTLLETAHELAFVVAAAVALIYLIMVIQFHSWLQPLVILAAVPLSFVGALVALLVTRQGVDVSVGMGVVTLVGISVNNAIVLLDYANRRAASGQAAPDALLSAASVRLRPILMTALTTIFALLPTAVGAHVGSQLFQPFAITVIGGLLSSTAATLLVIPALSLGRGVRS